MPTTGIGISIAAEIFGALSLHPKIPFPAVVVEREVRAQLKPYSVFCAAVIRAGAADQLGRSASPASRC